MAGAHVPDTPAERRDTGFLPETSEQRYRTLFQFVPIPLIQLDRTELAVVFQRLRADGVRDLAEHIRDHPDFVAFALNSIRIRELNAAALQLFGASDPQALLGPVGRLWTEDPEIFARSMAARFAGADRFESEIRVRAEDGRLLDVLYVTNFPEALRHEPLGLAALVDITERRRQQQALERLQAEFAHAARISLMGEVTASIAHEVNQPLAAILTNAEAAMRWLDRAQPDIGELKALSRRTIADAHRAADIIARVRSMAGRKAPERLPLDLNAVVHEALAFVGPELQKRDVTVQLDLAHKVPEIVADRVQLQQVVANIAMNAMQAMETSPVKQLVVRTFAGGTSVAVEIEDSGSGISLDQAGRLFESFFTTKANGMGIGLAICRSIIEAHGGSIAAENRPGGGARFRFSLSAGPPAD